MLWPSQSPGPTAAPYPCCVTSGKLLGLSVFQFPMKTNHRSTCFLESLWELGESLVLEVLEQPLLDTSPPETHTCLHVHARPPRVPPPPSRQGRSLHEVKVLPPQNCVLGTQHVCRKRGCPLPHLLKLPSGQFAYWFVGSAREGQAGGTGLGLGWVEARGWGAKKMSSAQTPVSGGLRPCGHPCDPGS